MTLWRCEAQNVQRLAYVAASTKPMTLWRGGLGYRQSPHGRRGIHEANDLVADMLRRHPGATYRRGIHEANDLVAAAPTQFPSIF